MSSRPTIFFVGTQVEVGHHAAPLCDSGLASQFELRVAPPADVCREAVAGDFAIFYTEHFDRFRQACTELRQRSVATIYLIDGILEWRNAWENRPDEPACPFAMRPVLAHKAACIGPAQARILGSWGNAAQVEVVGIPRLDRLVPSRQGRVPDNTFRVLVMTAKCPGFTEAQIETTSRSLRELRDQLATQVISDGRSVVPVWRLTGGLAEALEVDNQLNDLSGLELAEQLEHVDAVITTSSTAMLEAMRLEKPVALLDYHATPRYVPAAWTITHRSQIETVLKQLAEPDPARMNYQNFLLQDQLYSEGSSVARMSTLIRHMAESARQQLVEGAGELEFPAGMLPAVSGQTEWNAKEIFEGYSEFNERDLERVQAQLAHARREIDFLNRELDQARSELGQAHQIFEQIHNHPIAGPIVRARQKMLDFLGAAKRTIVTGKEVEDTNPASPAPNKSSAH